MSKLKCVTEICIEGKWVREDKLDPIFVKDVIYNCIDVGMRNANFVKVGKKGAVNECKD